MLPGKGLVLDNASKSPRDRDFKAQKVPGTHKCRQMITDYHRKHDISRREDWNKLKLAPECSMKMFTSSLGYEMLGTNGKNK